MIAVTRYATSTVKNAKQNLADLLSRGQSSWQRHYNRPQQREVDDSSSHFGHPTARQHTALPSTHPPSSALIANKHRLSVLQERAWHTAWITQLRAPLYPLCHCKQPCLLSRSLKSNPFVRVWLTAAPLRRQLTLTAGHGPSHKSAIRLHDNLKILSFNWRPHAI